MQLTSKKKIAIAAAVAVFGIGGLATATNSTDPALDAAPTPVATTTQATPTTTMQAAPKTTAPKMTSEQENAIGTAILYLSSQSFSRKGLIEQLVYEQYSKADATFAVDRLKVDWNEQAAKKAAEYRAYRPFSRKDLIDQLKYEGFTAKQAQYGVSAAKG